MKGAGIDLALEINDLAHRSPVWHPAPAIEFRLCGGIEAEFVFIAGETQKEPALLLPDAHGLGATANITRGQAITQPITGAADQLDILFLEADLLSKLSIKRLLGPLISEHPSLGKLPATPARPAAQEKLARPAHQDDADVGAKTG